VVVKALRNFQQFGHVANPPLEKVEPNYIGLFGYTFPKGGLTRELHAFHAPCWGQNAFTYVYPRQTVDPKGFPKGRTVS